MWGERVDRYQSHLRATIGSIESMLNSVDLREVWRDLDVLEDELDKEAEALEQAWAALCELDAENTVSHEEIAGAEELIFIDRDAVMRIDVGEWTALS
jgi:hypothetical protein